MMASLPKSAKWIEPLRGSKIILEVTGCEFFDASEYLDEALRDGTIRAQRKVGDSDAVEMPFEYWRDEQKVRDDRNSGHMKFEINQDDLMAWLSPAKKKSPPKQGRPPKWDWEAFWIWAVRTALSKDLPDRQSEFVKMAQIWFVDYHGGEPAESEIKARASKLYRAMAGK